MTHTILGWVPAIVDWMATIALFTMLILYRQLKRCHLAAKTELAATRAALVEAEGELLGCKAALEAKEAALRSCLDDAASWKAMCEQLRLDLKAACEEYDRSRAAAAVPPAVQQALLTRDRELSLLVRVVERAAGPARRAVDAVGRLNFSTIEAYLANTAYVEEQRRKFLAAAREGADAIEQVANAMAVALSAMRMAGIEQQGGGLREECRPGPDGKPTARRALGVVGAYVKEIPNGPKDPSMYLIGEEKRTAEAAADSEEETS